MNNISEINYLQINDLPLNHKLTIELVKKLIKQLDFTHDIPREEVIYFKKRERLKSTFWGNKVVECDGTNKLKLVLNEDNRVYLIKRETRGSEFNVFVSEKVLLNMKLKQLKLI